MEEKVHKKYKELQEELDMYVSELVNGHLYTEDYLIKRILEVKLEINLLEELMENED